MYWLLMSVCLMTPLDQIGPNNPPTFSCKDGLFSDTIPFSDKETCIFVAKQEAPKLSMLLMAMKAPIGSKFEVKCLEEKPTELRNEIPRP